jgi:FkbM family methyltransferase
MKKWLTYQLRKLTRPKVVHCGDVTLYIGDLADTSYARSIYRGSHECEELEVIRRHLRPEDRVLEFGSGIGLITVTCCQVVGSENVVTYEANPAMEPLLRKTFSLNGLAPDLRMKMVSINSGQEKFYVSDRFVVSSQFNHQSRADELSVSSDAFQDVVRDVQPTFLVMDIEGSEVDLADESIDLGCITKICVEVHPNIVGDEPTSRFIQSLLNRGFRLELSSSKGDVLFFQRATAEPVAQLRAA